MRKARRGRPASVTAKPLPQHATHKAQGHVRGAARAGLSARATAVRTQGAHNPAGGRACALHASGRAEPARRTVARQRGSGIVSQSTCGRRLTLCRPGGQPTSCRMRVVMTALRQVAVLAKARWLCESLSTMRSSSAARTGSTTEGGGAGEAEEASVARLLPRRQAGLAEHPGEDGSHAAASGAQGTLQYGVGQL